jgi:hypothetical protein
MIDISKYTSIKTYPLMDIPGFPHYKINDYGEIVSFYKRIKTTETRGTQTIKCETPQKLLEPHFNQDNYKDVFIKDTYGKQRIRLVHQLVLEANGHPKPFPDAEVRHLDGDRQNNHISNLKWGTSAENSADLVKHGTLAGEKNPAAKLTGDDVIFLRKNKHLPIKYLVERFKVCACSISMARNGRTFKNIPND